MPIARGIRTIPVRDAQVSSQSSPIAGPGRTAPSCGPGRGLVPLHELPVPDLLKGLMAEYMLAKLTETAAEALAVQNAVRFVAMESARDNVGRKLGSLRLDASRGRPK